MPKIKDLLLGSAEIAIGIAAAYASFEIAMDTGFYPAPVLGIAAGSVPFVGGIRRILRYETPYEFLHETLSY